MALLPCILSFCEFGYLFPELKGINICRIALHPPVFDMPIFQVMQTPLNEEKINEAGMSSLVKHLPSGHKILSINKARINVSN